MKWETPPKDSHVFIMRIWVDEAHGDNGQAALRGRVQHILGEEVRSFHDWDSLVDALQGMLALSAKESNQQATN